MGSVGVGRGTSVDSGVTPGLERQSVKPLLLPPPGCQMLAEVQSYYQLHTCGWHVSLGLLRIQSAGEKKRNFSLVELSVG